MDFAAPGTRANLWLRQLDHGKQVFSSNSASTHGRDGAQRDGRWLGMARFLAVCGR